MFCVLFYFDGLALQLSPFSACLAGSLRRYSRLMALRASRSLCLRRGCALSFAVLGNRLLALSVTFVLSVRSPLWRPEGGQASVRAPGSICTGCGCNDPYAGSPTKTLLRLLLPLNAQVWSTSRQQGRIIRSANSPWTSLKRSIGSSDGRCVQRAGT